MTDSSTQGIRTVLHPRVEPGDGQGGVHGIKSKLAEVTAAGAAVKEPPRDVGGGRLVATITEHDANVLALIQDR